jgi:hypothetical protein
MPILSEFSDTYAEFDSSESIIPRDNPISPWENEPYRLHSWWGMEKFSAANFYNIVEQLQILSDNAKLDAEVGKGTFIIEAH